MSVEKKSLRVSKLDALYAIYVANKNDESLSSLLDEVRCYARRILIRGGYSNRIEVDEVSQSAVVKIWQDLARYSGLSMFRSWCHRIIINTAIDEMRRANNRPEIPLSLDYDVLASPNHYVGAYRNTPAEHDSEGSVTGGGRVPLLKVYGDSDDWTDDVAEQHYYSDILDILIDALDNEDQRLVISMYRVGFSPRRIAAILHEKPKKISNLLTLAKQALRDLLKQNPTVERLSDEEIKPSSHVVLSVVTD